MIAFLCLALFFLGSCSLSGSVPAENSAVSQQLTVVSWNVQTFFDAQTDGIEYSEFIRSKVWSQNSYIKRVERLCATIKTLDADVFVMEEVENSGVLYDISNFLAGEWNSRKIYSYGCFAKDEGSGIGCAVLSRWPLEDLTVHGFCVRGNGGAELSVPGTRPLMQVTVRKNDRPLVLLISHWKSMSGGEEETEPWRMRQEDVLSRRAEMLVADGRPFLCAGDFNRSVENFSVGAKDDEGAQVFLRQIQNGREGRSVLVHSPWYRASGSLIKPGSYYYKGEWSRIDNMFLGGGAISLGFMPCTNGPWCDEETSVPVRYIINTGTGYSDHLPIKIEVSF